MSRNDEQRIADILDVASEVASVVAVGDVAFINDPIRIRAAERLLEIIGEAVNALSSATTDAHPDVPWRDIARLRIVLAHHYHRVDPRQVYVIAVESVPDLVEALSSRDG